MGESNKQKRARQARTKLVNRPLSKAQQIKKLLEQADKYEDQILDRAERRGSN